MEYIQNSHSPSVLTFLGLEIHIKEQTVYHNGTLILLAHHEFFTLLYLARHSSLVLSQSVIYEAAWKEPGDKCQAAIVNVVSQIRLKIGDGYIEIVAGSRIGLWGEIRAGSRHLEMDVAISFILFYNAEYMVT